MPSVKWAYNGRTRLVRAYACTSRRIESFDAKKGTVRFATAVRVWPTYKDEAKWFYF